MGTALNAVARGPFPQAVTRRRPKTPLRGRRPPPPSASQAMSAPQRTRPTHGAPASPEASGAAAPASRPPAESPRRASPGRTCHGGPCHRPAPLPGDVEGQREDPKTEWLPSLPERPRACEQPATRESIQAAGAGGCGDLAPGHAPFRLRHEDRAGPGLRACGVPLFPLTSAGTRADTTLEATPTPPAGGGVPLPLTWVTGACPARKGVEG